MSDETLTCQRELTVEIPVEEVEKETTRVTREFARVARLPGFRPGKAPASLVRQRFWKDIKGEVLQSLVPTSLEHALEERKLAPVGEPSIADLEFEPEKPLRFKATFEVLPEFELGPYKELEVEPARLALEEADLERELEALRESVAVYEPVEGRTAEDGDTVIARLAGVVTQPDDRTEPITMERAIVHLGAETTLPAFTEALRGAKPEDERHFEVTYPGDYPQSKLAGNRAAFTARVQEVKRKKLPALDDAFAQQVSDAKTLDELKNKVRERLEEARKQREQELTRQGVLDALLANYSFPVPEALIERGMNARVERQVRALVSQGVDPRQTGIDWHQTWKGGREAAERETRLALLLERIAEAENIAASDEDLQKEIERAAAESQKSAEAVRSRLTKEGRLDSIKRAIRSEKVVDFLLAHARLTAPDRD